MMLSIQLCLTTPIPSLLMVCSITYLCEGLHQVGHHFVLVLCQDAVQGGSSLAVLPKHKEARIFLIRRGRGAVVLEVLHRNAEKKIKQNIWLQVL